MSHQPSIPGIPPALSFQLLKKRVSIESVLRGRGLLEGLRRQGSRLVGCCPIHGGDNPHAFVVTPSQGLWNCFTRCGGGDVVELIRLLDGVSHGEVARLLSEAPQARTSLSCGESSSAVRSFRPYDRRLPLDGRAPFLAAKGITPLTASVYEVGAYHGRGLLRGCIGARLHDPDGGPLGYGGRRLDADEVERRGKWVFPRGLPKGRLLYGLHHLRSREEEVVLVECPWGVMRLYQLGVPAVSCLGTSLSRCQVRLLSSFRGVKVLFDGDSGGHDGEVRVVSVLGGLMPVDVLSLPAEHDPDDLPDKALYQLVS